MYSNEIIVVRKYVNVLHKFYTTPWQLEQLEQLENLKQLLGPHHGVLSYLRLDCIAEKRKYELIMKAIHSLHLAEILGPLIYLLKKNKHLALLHTIVSELIIGVKKQLKIEDITIYSAHALADEDRMRIEEWVKQQRHAHIIRSDMVVQPELIAGFRIEGHNFMGDYSVYRQLHNLKYLCIKEGHIS
jgi:ATP synthase F1 delta subunit